jgi:hypothetical protein
MKQLNSMENITTVTYGGSIKKYAETTPSADEISPFYAFKTFGEFIV